MRPYVIWPWICGLSWLAVGLFFSRRRLLTARGLDKLVVLGPTFMASALVAFGAEHLTIPQAVMGLIPSFYPGRLFLVYFVAAGLFAAGTSFVIHKLVGLSATLLGLMFAIFVATMHVPGAMKSGDHVAWIVALRDLSFGGGAMALAGALGVGRLRDGSSWLGTLGRIIVGTACLVFGVVHFFQPTHTPGVPLPKMMPPWLPAGSLWGYVTGLLEIAAGSCMLANRQTREAAGGMGLVLVALVLVVYMPFVATAVEGGDKIEALNYVFDTLLFAGAVLCVGSSRAALE